MRPVRRRQPRAKKDFTDVEQMRRSEYDRGYRTPEEMFRGPPPEAKLDHDTMGGGHDPSLVDIVSRLGGTDRFDDGEEEIFGYEDYEQADKREPHPKEHLDQEPRISDLHRQKAAARRLRNK